MDKIKIQNLEVYANHGVFPEENKLGQKFVVTMILYLNTRMAGKTDTLSYSVHYGEVSHFATDFLQNHTYKLIEAAAENLAEAILLKYDQIEKIQVTLHKPWAPIGLPLEDIAVEIERGWHTAYIAVGSNMGDREKYITQAIQEIKKMPECHVTKVSKLIETKAYGKTDQEDFINGCLELKTLFNPEELLDQLHIVERKAGRERNEHWGPRTLDLDILFYDNEIVETQELVIPHLDMNNREFVLEPLAEIAPYFEHPVDHKNILQLLLEVRKQ